MCGIVGYIGHRLSEPILVDGLARLEYRGYDSAGVATISDGIVHVCRATGKLLALRNLLSTKPCPGTVGIGHTRWATHGKPSEHNAHPHTAGDITVVHNGIIENHGRLRALLVAEGCIFSSETDTEIFAHLILRERKMGHNLKDAVKSAISSVEGAYALAVIDAKTPDCIAFAKMASPLVVGIGEGEHFLASDVSAVLTHTRQFIFLEDGDVGLITQEGFHIDGRGANQSARTIQWSHSMAEKDGHKHFMHKEIHEQPRAVAETLRGRLLFNESRVSLDDVDTRPFAFLHRIVITACGSSYHAALIGKSMIEKLARIPCDVELASELRYRDPVFDKNTLVVAISQSGETADTLAALKEALQRGAHALGICNVIDAAIPRAAERSLGTLYTRAGPEIGVASTKAFVTQIVALHLLAISLGQTRGYMTDAHCVEEMNMLACLPLEMEKLLKQEEHINSVAQYYAHTNNMLYLGRGLLYPIALEGALKLKEISYIHAEGYAAGEMKHGPIALIDESMPVVVLAIKGPGYEKTISNLEEVRARGGKIIAVCVDDDTEIASHAEAVLRIPASHSLTIPCLAVIPLQLLAYHIANIRGSDVDQPRNLAKSVTVE